MTVRAVVWGENVHEQTSEAVRAIYPDGMHATIAAALGEDRDIEATTATLQEPEHGLQRKAAGLDRRAVVVGARGTRRGQGRDRRARAEARLGRHGPDRAALRPLLQDFQAPDGHALLAEMARGGRARTRSGSINRGHPIAQGLGECIEVAETEMYGEPFAVPEPMETVFISWYEGGEVFRSGMTWQRGAGRIFYFSPGHETYPVYHNKGVRQVLRNAVHWAHNASPAWTAITDAPNVPVGSAKEKIVQKGARAARRRRQGPAVSEQDKSMNRLLLLGTGGIAGSHVQEFAKIPGMPDRRLRRSGARPRAKNSRRRTGSPQHFESLEAALAWGEFDAAINATPDGAHMPTTLALLAAGKHVFCEKPLAPSYPDALAMTEAAEKAGLVNMVNLTYRNSPALQQARKMVAGRRDRRVAPCRGGLSPELAGRARPGATGAPMDQWLWRLSTKHGSTGVLGDVGIHILDFASFGAADDIVSLKADLVTFPKAEGDRIGDYALDANDSVAMTARLKSGALATILATRYATGHANDLTLALHGTQGRAEGRDQRTGIDARRLPRQGHRQEPLEDAGDASGQAQCPAFCRRADF